MKKKVSNFLIYICIPIFCLAVLFGPKYIWGVEKESVEYSDIVKMINSGEIKEFSLNISSGKMEYTKTDDSKDSVVIANPTFFHEDVGKTVIEKGIKARYTKSISTGSLISIASLCIMLFAVVFIMKRLGGKGKDYSPINTFNKIKNKGDSPGGVKFKDIAGAEEEKGELEEVVEFLKNPEKFSSAGARIPKGILLVGPPGTGKTLLARAVAGEAGVPFFSVSGSDFVEMFVGVGASRVRNLFEQAKKQGSAIVFIDEIDAVGRQRGTGVGGGNDEREQTLNQILVELDGFSKNDNVIVLAATNRPDVLDKALLRPGRFDRQVVVNLPDVTGRAEILKIHGKNKKFAPDITPESIASMTSGFSGADLENLLNEAALLSIRAGRTAISKDDLDEAVLKVVMGNEKKSRVLSSFDKKITAYHESGHAIVSYNLPSQEGVRQISIIPRGMAAGFTMYKSSVESEHMSRTKLLDTICSLLGGRAAEEIVFGEIYTGASNDIARATELAKKMVTEWGMTDTLGLVNLSNNKDQPFLGKSIANGASCSEETMKAIDAEIKKIIDVQYARAKQILTRARNKMDVVSVELIKKEKLDEEEFRNIMQR